MCFNKLFLIILLSLSFQLQAAQIKVAVATNFSSAMSDIISQFEQNTAHTVVLITGSTGKLYAQIHNGAPFDAFFAADTKRPRQLELDNKIQPGSRFTYAIGKIVLWSPDPALIDTEGNVITSSSFRHLAIANPKLAPYGRAAQQVIESKGVWNTLQGKIVRGENIGQTYHFVNSGNAELGFVALSQIKQNTVNQHGSFWLVPAELYEPIEQQAVQLTTQPGVADFFQFVKSKASHHILSKYGYDVP